MGGFSLLVELRREGSAPAACAAGLIVSKTVFKGFKPCPKLLKEVLLTDPVNLGLFFKNLCDSLSRWSFCSESSRHCLSKNVRVRELKFWENDHPPPCVTCHVSHVTCHIFIYFLFFIFGGKSGGASWWSVCYQRGLRRLVFIQGPFLVPWMVGMEREGGIVFPNILKLCSRFKFSTSLHFIGY